MGLFSTGPSLRAKRQWAQIGIQGILFKRTLSCCEGDQTLDQAAPRGHGISTCGEILKPLLDKDLSNLLPFTLLKLGAGVEGMVSRAPSQPRLSCGPGFCSQLALPTSFGGGLLLGRSQPPASHLLTHHALGSSSSLLLRDSLSPTWKEMG